MPFSLLLRSLSSDDATVELLNGFAVRSPVPHRWILNGTPIHAGRQNVVTLRGLREASDYELRVVLEEQVGELFFRTPSVAERICVREFGLVTRKSENHTELIQRAIDKAPAGSVVVVPRGRWVCGPLYFSNSIDLFLERGAILSAHSDFRNWPILTSKQAGSDGHSADSTASWEGDPSLAHAALINAHNVQDIRIRGEGIIDGGGKSETWWSRPKKAFRARRPRTIHLLDATRISISGISVRNPAVWAIHSVRSADLTFVDLKIRAPSDTPNTDGINPESCKNVVIAGVDISTGDDCIALKSGRLGHKKQELLPTQNVVVSNSCLRRGHGAVTIGSEMSGGVSDVLIQYCRFEHTDRGLRLKTRRGRGGKIENVVLQHVYMTGVGTPVSINCFYSRDEGGMAFEVRDPLPRPVTSFTPAIRQVSLRSVKCDGVKHCAGAIWGLPEKPVEQLSFHNFCVRFDPSASPGYPDMAQAAIPIVNGGLQLHNIRALELDRVDIQGSRNAAISKINVV